jgi:hypothetical protein
MKMTKKSFCFKCQLALILDRNIGYPTEDKMKETIWNPVESTSATNG